MEHIDVTTLIKEVQKRQVLWDLLHKEHNNRLLLEKQWMEIATLLNVSVREVRQKWKYLRDQHRREVRKISESAAEGIAIYEPTWKYYRALCFLDGQITQRHEKNTFASYAPDSDVPKATVKADIWEETETLVFEDTMQSESSFTHPKSEDEDHGRKRKRPKADVDANLLAYLVKLERKKIDLLLAQDDARKEEKSDDFYFMSSLLPIMKTFSNMQKLRVRNKILQVIMDEMEGDYLNVSPESSGR